MAADLALQVVKTMDEMRSRKELCDLTVVVNSLKFYVHKVVMSACSQVIHRQLVTCPPQTKVTVVIQSISVETWECVLRFAYCGADLISWENVQDLLAASKLLHMQTLRDACISFLVESLSASNYLAVAKIASAVKCQQLSKVLNDYILEHFPSVFSEKEFLDLDLGEFVEYICDGTLVQAFPDELKSVAENWVCHNEEERRPLLRQISDKLSVKSQKKGVQDESPGGGGMKTSAGCDYNEIETGEILFEMTCNEDDGVQVKVESEHVELASRRQKRVAENAEVSIFAENNFTHPNQITRNMDDTTKAKDTIKRMKPSILSSSTSVHADNDHERMNQSTSNQGISGSVCAENATGSGAQERQQTSGSSHPQRIINYPKGVNVKPYKCTICDQEFTLLESLDNHLLSIHDVYTQQKGAEGAGGKQFRCPYKRCKKMFATQAESTQHHNSVHSQKWSFKCDICSRQFYKQFHLDCHMKGHVNNADDNSAGSKQPSTAPAVQMETDIVGEDTDETKSADSSADATWKNSSDSDELAADDFSSADEVTADATSQQHGRHGDGAAADVSHTEDIRSRLRKRVQKVVVYQDSSGDESASSVNDEASEGQEEEEGQEVRIISDAAAKRGPSVQKPAMSASLEHNLRQSLKGKGDLLGDGSETGKWIRRKLEAALEHIEGVYEGDDKTRKRSFRCKLCKKVYMLKRDTRDHIVSMHFNIKRYVCPMCDFALNRRDSLVRHIKCIHNVDVNKTSPPEDLLQWDCKKCDRAFASRRKFRRHMQTHVSPSSKNRCGICGKQFLGAQHLCGHIKSCRGSDDGNGDVAGGDAEAPDAEFEKRFAEKMEEAGNLIEVVFESGNYNGSAPGDAENMEADADGQKGKASYQCKLCQKLYTVRKSARDHVLDSHFKIKRYTCTLCNSDFYRRAALVRHSLAIHDRDIRRNVGQPQHFTLKWKCEKCGQKFRAHKQLRQHKKVHNLHKCRYECEFCGKKISRANYFIKHVKGCRRATRKIQASASDVADHGGQETAQSGANIATGSAYTCNRCGMAFDRSSGLKRHVAVFHGKMQKYQCHYCQLSFSMKQNLNRHIEEVHIPLQCDICKLVFVDDQGLKNHQESQCWKECGVCSEQFSDKEQFLVHQRGKHENQEEKDREETQEEIEEKPHKCNFCEKRFRTQKGLYQHSFHHEQNSLKCHLCDLSFSSGPKLIEHVKNDHMNEIQQPGETREYIRQNDTANQTSADGINQIQSANQIRDGEFETASQTEKAASVQRDKESRQVQLSCNGPESSNNRDNGDTLLETSGNDCGMDQIETNMSKFRPYRREDEKVRPYKCTECPMSFNQERYLKRHLSIHSGKKMYKCYTCGRRFNKASTSHRCFYKCDKCDEQFTDPYSFRQHGFKHNDKDAYQCEICGWLFVSKCSLQSHMYTHLGIKPYKCRYCERTFVQYSSRMMHERKHTGEKPNLCEKCGKSFLSTSELHSHIRRNHSNVPTPTSFKCDYCPRTFSSRLSLGGHLGKHISNTALTCQVCGKVYRRRGNLEEHMRTHDGDQSQQPTTRSRKQKHPRKGRADDGRQPEDSAAAPAAGTGSGNDPQQGTPSTSAMPGFGITFTHSMDHDGMRYEQGVAHSTAVYSEEPVDTTRRGYLQGPEEPTMLYPQQDMLARSGQETVHQYPFTNNQYYRM